MSTYNGVERRGAGQPATVFPAYAGPDRRRQAADGRPQTAGIACPQCGFNADAVDEIEAARVKAVEDRRVLDIEYSRAVTRIEDERAAVAEKLRLAGIEAARVRAEQASQRLAEARQSAVSSQQTAVFAGVERRGVIAATVFPAYTGPDRRR